MLIGFATNETCQVILILWGYNIFIMKILKATRKYETWLREQMDVFEEDLALKAERLAKDPFTFFRGTFYRWMQVFPDKCRKAWRAPIVLSVGDLHAANFGTWHDATGAGEPARTSGKPHTDSTTPSYFLPIWLVT